MKGIANTGAPKIHVPGWVGGWMGGWVGVKAVLRIACSNQKYLVDFLAWLDKYFHENVSQIVTCDLSFK
jgi:hypothetical protein